MLLDSLERLAGAESAYRETYEVLAGYFAQRRDWQLIDPVTLAQDLPLLDSFSLAGALMDAVDAGELSVKYTVLTPDGVVAADLYDSPLAIPEHLPDRFEEEFQTHKFPLVTVFEAKTSGGAANFREMEAGS